MISAATRDEAGFERHAAQAKAAYDACKRMEGKPIERSDNESLIVGLNLLRLLVQNRIAEFHTELELIPNEGHDDRHVAFCLDLESSLMEGAYYHNPGTAGIAFATMSATKNDIRAVAAAPFGDSIATVAPDLLGTTMEVTVLRENQPPSVIFGTAGGTQVVITQHNRAGDGTAGEFYVNSIGEPTYDGLMDATMSGGVPAPSIFHSATLLKTDGTATTLDTT